MLEGLLLVRRQDALPFAKLHLAFGIEVVWLTGGPAYDDSLEPDVRQFQEHSAVALAWAAVLLSAMLARQVGAHSHLNSHRVNLVVRIIDGAVDLVLLRVPFA